MTMQLDPNGLAAAKEWRGHGTTEQIIRAYLEATPSPSPAPGVVTTWDVEATAEEIARQLAAEVKSFGPTGRIHGETYAAAKAGALEAFKRALASLSQPSKGEREGGRT